MQKTSDPAVSSGTAGLQFSILKPGRNCWCIERAERAAVLIDGASYFSRLDQGLRSARRSILIVGWDFDGRIRLRPDAGEDSPPLGDLLRSLVETHSELEIRILIWSIATLHAPGETLPLIAGAKWQDHPASTCASIASTRSMRPITRRSSASTTAWPLPAASTSRSNGGTRSGTARTTLCG